MDSLFVEGIAVTVSAIIVFCGSVWLLLALLLGPRLAYFVTASVTLAFLLLMGVVWSIGEPLGPVGELPSFETLGVAESTDEIQFGPAGDYPDAGGWFVPSEDDAAASDIMTGAEGAATGELEDAIEADEITVFENAQQATVDSDGTRLLERDGTFFAAVRLEPVATEPAEGDPPSDEDITPEGEGDSPAEDDAAAQDQGPGPDAEAFVFLQQHPGNPSGKARIITGGFLVLLVAHLLGLSQTEKRARRVP